MKKEWIWGRGKVWGGGAVRELAKEREAVVGMYCIWEDKFKKKEEELSEVCPWKGTLIP